MNPDQLKIYEFIQVRKGKLIPGRTKIVATTYPEAKVILHQLFPARLGAEFTLVQKPVDTDWEALWKSVKGFAKTITNIFK